MNSTNYFCFTFFTSSHILISYLFFLSLETQPCTRKQIGFLRGKTTQKIVQMIVFKFFFTLKSYCKTQEIQFSSVQLLSRVQLFTTPWTAAHQDSLSITNSQSLLKLMSIESVMPSSYLILCHPLLLLPSIFLSIKIFSNESVLGKELSGGQNIRVSASASVLPMNIQD